MNDFNFKAFIRNRDTQIEFQEVSTVPKNTVTTVLSFTNVGSVLKLEGIGGSGTARSEWSIFINSVLKVKRRLSVAHPFIDIDMFDTQLANLDIIDVKVEHFEPATQDFDAEVRYFV